MWDRVPPEIEAFSPDNLLIFATGLLCGTPAIGCNRTFVTTISLQTQLLPFSMMGGFWALKLKYAGYHKVIEECAFCRSPCPSRDDFKEPDSSLPLKCDMCEGEDEPLCVKWCITDALIVEELKIGLESLVEKHGMQKIMDAVVRMSSSSKFSK